MCGIVGILNLIERLPAEVDVLLGDSSKARKVLGWEPSTSLREGMTRTYAWIEQQYADRKNDDHAREIQIKPEVLHRPS